MKKILMSLAIAAAMMALASCSCCNNCRKAAEEPAAVEACTECEDKACCEKKTECCEKKAECEKKCCEGCDSTAVKECCKAK